MDFGLRTSAFFRISTFGFRICFASAVLATTSLLSQTYTFDDGLLPAGTTFPTTNGLDGIGHNLGSGVTNAGGFNNSGMLIMTVPGSGSTFSQWQLPDFAPGQLLTNLSVSFNVFMGGPVSGGNGMVFHWGPGALYQYTGSASSFGQGLDVTLRTFGSGVNTSGINVYYGGTNGPGNNPPLAANSFLGYYRGGVTNFSSNTWVSFSVAVIMNGTQTNAALNLTCSNAWNDLTNIYSNLLITNFVSPLTNHTMQFSATDGTGAHEFCFLDNVDFTVNGSHVGRAVTNPVVITSQPGNRTALVGTVATFSVGVSGTPPFTYQWFSNSVPISGANAASYNTPPVSLAMSGAVYAVTVSNVLGGLLSSSATLTVTTNPFAPFLLGSNLGVWGTNSDGTINDPFMNNPGIRSKAGAVLNFIRFPCRSFTSNQLQSIASTIANTGLVPLAILDDQDPTTATALAQVNALKGVVTYFELGNEDNYFHGWSGRTYGTNWANFVPTLKAAAPNARFIGPVGSDFDHTGSQFLRDFLTCVKTNPAPVPDFISMHYYSAHGEKPPWTSSKIMTDVNSEMLPGIVKMNSDIASILGGPISLAITEWNYDACPECNTNTLDTDGAFMTNYTGAVLDIFNTNGVWAACQYDFAAGAGGGHLDMVTTSGSAKPQYNEFINWRNIHSVVSPVLATPVLSNGFLTLTWSGGGVLQSRTNLTDPWSDLTSASNPFMFPLDPAVPHQFWRVIIRQ